MTPPRRGNQLQLPLCPGEKQSSNPAARLCMKVRVSVSLNIWSYFSYSEMSNYMEIFEMFSFFSENTISSLTQSENSWFWSTHKKKTINSLHVVVKVHLLHLLVFSQNLRLHFRLMNDRNSYGESCHPDFKSGPKGAGRGFRKNWLASFPAWSHLHIQPKVHRCEIWPKLNFYWSHKLKLLCNCFLLLANVIKHYIYSS